MIWGREQNGHIRDTYTRLAWEEPIENKPGSSLLRQTTTTTKKFTVGADSETCTWQERTQGTGEKANGGLMGRAPPTGEVSDLPQKRTRQGANTVDRKNEGEIYKRVEAEGTDRERERGGEREGHWERGKEGVLHY